MLFYTNDENILKDILAEKEVDGVKEIQEIPNQYAVVSEDPATNKKILELYNLGEKFYHVCLDDIVFEKDIKHSLIIRKSDIIIPCDKSTLEFKPDSTFVRLLEELGEYFEESLPVIQLFNSSALNDIIVRTNMKTMYTGVTPIVSSSNFSGILRENNIEDPNMDKRLEQKKLIKLLDSNESLSYIEPQLDILSSVVFKMVEAIDGLADKVKADITYYDSFKKSVVDNAVTTVKSADKCLEEINNIKAKVREVQTKYYNKEL